MTSTPQPKPGKTFADSLWLRFFPRLAGGITAALGLIVLIGWHANWTVAVQVLPGMAPMKYNTALGFILCGSGLVLLGTRRAWLASWLGGLAGLAGLLTLLEYLAGRNFGMDELFFKDYLQTATEFPGRMSPVAASCFIFIGTGLALMALGKRWPGRLTGTGLLACMAVMISAVVFLFGYLLGIELAYGWGAYTHMALHTSVTFMLLGGGLFVWTWRQSREEQSNFIRWVPAIGSVTLMAMVGIVSMVSLTELKQAIYWHGHAYQVLSVARNFEGSLVDTQRGMREYLLTSSPESVELYRHATNEAPRQLARLAELVRDNPEQEQHLETLASKLEEIRAYSLQLMVTHEREGLPAAIQLEKTSQRLEVMKQARAELDAFTQEEQRLLAQRDDAAETNFHNTARLLIFGSALAAGLLALASLLANREVKRRTQAEAVQLFLNAQLAADIAKRKQAEARLAEQSAELQRSNQELEQFAYVASHDMREPLRAVTGFAQMLKAQSRGQLGENAENMIGHIVDGAKRMGGIIDDLLSLSRIGSQEKKHARTALEKPVAEALENLSVAIRERQAVIRQDALPALPVDSSQLALLFQNLIGNAIKFCRDRPPEVHIGARRDADGCWTISVRDNGIGIEPKYFEKIFGIFQRLHTRDEYPGTGIGLAICKKIVERHGGRIWPESAPGAGTVFYFTLPEQQKNYEQQTTGG